MSSERDRDEGPLARWSRRKAEARRVEPEPTPVEAEQEQAAEAAPEIDETLSDEELLEKLGLPDPDSLKQGDNAAQFLRAEVPERLRRRALRSLWKSDPVFAVLDGLNDYDLDYTDAAMGAGVVKTAYQIGQGFLTDEELKRPDEREAADAPGEEEAERSASDESMAETAPAGVEPATPEAGETVDEATPEEPEALSRCGAEKQSHNENESASWTVSAARPRRMKFRLDQE